jgi:hypothetical protein
MNNRTNFEYEVCYREYDKQWTVVAKLSAVRLGIVSREQVKTKAQQDYDKWLTLFVGESEKDCKKWVDEHWDNLVKLGIPYEVAS